MAATILVLGGYGTTGATLSELLLEHGDTRIVLAGRTLPRARALAAKLDARYPGRVSARRVDAGDPSSLDAAFADIDMVAVASSTLTDARTVIDAAVRAGIDYFDLQMSSETKLAALEARRERIEAEGRCFITDGGIHPGLAAVMIRAVAPSFARLEQADVAGLLRVDWTSYDFAQSTIHEFARELADYRVEALVDGSWSTREWKDAMKSFDFGPPFGRERCSLMYMEELRRLPEQLPSLRTCGFYISGFNTFTNAVMMPLGLLVMKLSPNGLGKPFARALTWSLRTFGRPPYGTVWQVEAEGVPAGSVAAADPAAVATGSVAAADPAAARSKGSADRVGVSGDRLRAGLRIMHPDGYWLTAASAAACLLQYADGSLRTPGVHLQALCVDPARLLRDLRRMGCRLEAYGLEKRRTLGLG